MPVIRPPKLLPVGRPVTLTFLTCPRCIWEISHAQLDKPPWSGSRRRYRCPGCRGVVHWHIHGPAWRPGSSSSDFPPAALPGEDLKNVADEFTAPPERGDATR